MNKGSFSSSIYLNAGTGGMTIVIIISIVYSFENQSISMSSMARHNKNHMNLLSIDIYQNNFTHCIPRTDFHVNQKHHHNVP